MGEEVKGDTITAITKERDSSSMVRATTVKTLMAKR